MNVSKEAQAAHERIRNFIRRTPVEPLITGKVGVEGVANAFEALSDPERHAKILVEPWRS